MNIRKSILIRVYLAFGLMVFGALLVFGKLLHLQYVDGDQWRAIADSLTIRERVIEAARGNIYSNDGSLLFRNMRYGLMRWPFHPSITMFLMLGWILWPISWLPTLRTGQQGSI